MNCSIWKSFSVCMTLTALTFTSIPAYAQINGTEVNKFRQTMQEKIDSIGTDKRFQDMDAIGIAEKVFGVKLTTQGSQTSIAGTYGHCYSLHGFGTPRLSGLGKFTLDGQGTYSSNYHGTGNYVFNPEDYTVRFSSGKMAGLLAKYSVDKKGRSGVNFLSKLNPILDRAHFCPNQNN